MFKGFQNTSKSHGFNGFPALNFQMNNEAYGFSGCTFWLDAAYGTNTVTDGANVSLWQSRIKNQCVFIQNTAAQQPLYRLSDPNFNNYPSVDFNTSSKYAFKSSNPIDPNLQSTLVFVVKVNSLLGGGGRNLFLTSDNVTGNNIYLGGGDAPFTGGIGYYTNLTAQLTSGVNNTNPHIVVFSFNSSSGNAFIKVDNTTTVTGTTTPVLSNWDQFGTTNASNAPVARIAEILLFNRQFSTTDADNIISRLNSKYAIY